MSQLMKLVDWPTIGVWFGAAVGVFVAGLVVSGVAGWSSRSQLPYIGVLSLAAWVFSTGIVRSVTTLNLSLSWLAGLVLALPIYYALGVIVVVFLYLIFALPIWLKERHDQKVE